ncbi:MAG: hypothetical protein OXP70_04155 [Acidobacteriota bacterium]|nr:hypothetical protein [Acidobacteriota bacterium]
MLEATAMALALNQATVTRQQVTISEAPVFEQNDTPPFVVWAEPGGERAEFSPEHMERGKKYPIRLNGTLYAVEKTERGDLEIYGIDESVA